MWCAREIVGEEAFALLLPDVLHHAAKPCIGEMMEAYRDQPGNYISVAPVPPEETHQYGIVGVEDASAKVSRITAMIEKPKAGQAPSNLHISGRATSLSRRFSHSRTRREGAGSEIQITDAMKRLAERDPFFAVRFDGTIYDCGGRMGFLLANIALALERDDFGPNPARRTCKALAAPPRRQ